MKSVQFKPTCPNYKPGDNNTATLVSPAKSSFDGSMAFKYKLFTGTKRGVPTMEKSVHRTAAGPHWL